MLNKFYFIFIIFIILLYLIEQLYIAFCLSGRNVIY